MARIVSVFGFSTNFRHDKQTRDGHEESVILSAVYILCIINRGYLDVVIQDMRAGGICVMSRILPEVGFYVSSLSNPLCIVCTLLLLILNCHVLLVT